MVPVLSGSVEHAFAILVRKESTIKIFQEHPVNANCLKSCRSDSPQPVCTWSKSDLLRIIGYFFLIRYLFPPLLLTGLKSIKDRFELMSKSKIGSLTTPRIPFKVNQRNIKVLLMAAKIPDRWEKKYLMLYGTPQENAEGAENVSCPPSLTSPTMGCWSVITHANFFLNSNRVVVLPNTLLEVPNGTPQLSSAPKLYETKHECPSSWRNS